MKHVYLPEPASDAELCLPEKESDFFALDDSLAGRPIGEAWQSPPMKLIQKDRGRKLARSDSPWLGSSSLVFRDKAVDGLQSLLTESGEVLPLSSSEPGLFIFHVTRIVDALDEEGSEVSRLSSGRIMSIERYKFRADVIAGLELFKITSLKSSPIFVGEHFVERWRELGLVGLDFQQIWKA